jgi:diguanylate cyclase (GGDEF)-like protein
VLEAAEVQSGQLERLVRQDPLTGVGNRRRLSETLAQQLPSHARALRPLSVLALDLNGFKELNDVVGHDAGDELLRRVALALATTVHSVDRVVRQGGDEFCVVLPNCSAEQAEGFVPVVRAALADLREGPDRVTTGVGVATFPDDAATADQLLAVADRRLSVQKAAMQRRRGEESSLLLAVETAEPLPEIGPTPAAPRWGTVARREIALDRTVWFAVRGLMAFYTALWAGCLIATRSPDPLAFASFAALAVVTIVVWCSEPPRLSSWLNHAVIAVPYVGSALLMLTMPRFAGLGLGALAFAGTLPMLRLVDRRQIIAHDLLATGAIAAVIAAGQVGLSVTIALLLMGLVIWGMTLSGTIYLEDCEQQGVELEALVRRDPLTGVGNRRMLGDQLDAGLRRRARTRQPLTVLALDLDGFKALNDNLGHAAGDELLRRVADCLTRLARTDDTVVRQGGDEFCVLLPDTSAEAAAPIADAIRAAIAALGDPEHPISTGLGMATCSNDATSAEDLLSAADDQLRADKASGSRGPLGVRLGAARATERDRRSAAGAPATA